MHTQAHTGTRMHACMHVRMRSRALTVKVANSVTHIKLSKQNEMPRHALEQGHQMIPKTDPQRQEIQLIIRTVEDGHNSGRSLL